METLIGMAAALATVLILALLLVGDPVPKRRPIGQRVQRDAWPNNVDQESRFGRF